jgi:hypothetical protein
MLTAVKEFILFPGKSALQRGDDAIRLGAHPAMVVDEGGRAGTVVIDAIERFGHGI